MVISVERGAELQTEEAGTCPWGSEVKVAGGGWRVGGGAGGLLGFGELLKSSSAAPRKMPASACSLRGADACVQVEGWPCCATRLGGVLTARQPHEMRSSKF